MGEKIDNHGGQRGSKPNFRTWKQRNYQWCETESLPTSGKTKNLFPGEEFVNGNNFSKEVVRSEEVRTKDVGKRLKKKRERVGGKVHSPYLLDVVQKGK